MKCDTTDTTESRSNTQTPDPQTTASNTRPEVDFQAGEERFRLAFENEDITERKRIEWAASAKSAFISRMSHELRAPLHIILGFIEMLERLEVRSQAVAGEEDLSRKRLEMLDAVQRNARHLLSLVDEVLDFDSLDQEPPEAVRLDDSAADLQHDPGGVYATCRVAPDLRADWPSDAGSGVGPESGSISYPGAAYERRAGEDRDLVLVIDDALDTLHLTSEMLSEQGLRMVGARDGAAGLRLAAARQPQLVLLDIGLPDLDGFQVCARLKAEPATWDIPVVFFSARDQVEDRARGFAVGAVDYVVKPFDLRELRLRLINHLRLSRQSRSLGCEAAPGEGNQRDGAEASLLSRRALEIFICARDRMLADLNATPDLTQLARACGTNRTSLQHLFQTQLGLSVFGYLREQRLQRALVLLRAGRGVDVVAQEVGYGSGHSLSRAFKQRFGIPPGALSRAFQGVGL